MALPGTDDWEATALAWMLAEPVPNLRQHAVRRYQVILAAIARGTLPPELSKARGTATAPPGRNSVKRSPPHAVDAALTAYRDELRGPPPRGQLA